MNSKQKNFKYLGKRFEKTHCTNKNTSHYRQQSTNLSINDDLNPNPSQSYLEIFYHLYEKQGDDIMLKEIHEEMLDIYANKMKHISDTSAKLIQKL